MVLDYDTVARKRPDSSLQGTDIDILRLYSAALNRWPLILATAVLGALLGIAFSLGVPATFQAVAELSIGIDHGRVEFLDEDAERQILLRVQDLLLSDAVMAGAIEKLPPILAGMSEIADPADYRQRLRLTRIEARWQLAATDPVPEQAAALANSWADSALETLEEAQTHAWKVAELQAVFFEVACRPMESGLWACDKGGINASGRGLDQELLQEIRASYGIAPVVSFALLERAAVPDRPQSSARAAIAAAGTLLGMLVGFGLAVRRSSRGSSRVDVSDLGPEESTRSARGSEGP